MPEGKYRRRRPIGAETVSGGGVHFRVWAPIRKKVEVVIEFEKHLESPMSLALEREHGGYFSGFFPDAEQGTLYRYRLDDEPMLYPDPASRYQPAGPHGPSEVIEPDIFKWTDDKWRGLRIKGQVIYEMHVGTFTQEGTWNAAQKELPELADFGITVIEMMPAADFPGRFGWGYDGVNMFAPTRLYGEPDDLRMFINKAHELGMAVILDVVYNHFGPDGNYLRAFSPDYFTSTYKNEWGEPNNFDGPNSAAVREFFITNACYWVDEFHFDGLRLDATQQMYDNSSYNILAEITEKVRKCAQDRALIIIGENEPQRVKLIKRPEEGGYGFDGLWNDDFHHSAHVAMTGRGEAYYSDYAGTAQELLSAMKWGYIYQGQRSRWQKQARGTSTSGIERERFIYFIENHDQAANRAHGLRCNRLTSLARFRAMSALILLGPGTPMLFMGQEFAASSPFQYFSDHKPELQKLVAKGRVEFLSQFLSLANPEMSPLLEKPDEAAFKRSKLDFGERVKNFETYFMYKQLMQIRKQDPVFSRQGQDGLDGAVIGTDAFLLRFFGQKEDDRLMLVNLGRDIHLQIEAEPLLAPPGGRRWEKMWSSEDAEYGGGGTGSIICDDGWHIPAESTIVLRPEPNRRGQ